MTICVAPIHPRVDETRLGGLYGGSPVYDPHFTVFPTSEPRVRCRGRSATPRGAVQHHCGGGPHRRLHSSSCCGPCRAGRGWTSLAKVGNIHANVRFGKSGVAQACHGRMRVTGTWRFRGGLGCSGERIVHTFSAVQYVEMVGAGGYGAIGARNMKRS